MDVSDTFQCQRTGRRASIESRGACLCWEPSDELQESLGPGRARKKSLKKSGHFRDLFQTFRAFSCISDRESRDSCSSSETFFQTFRTFSQVPGPEGPKDSCSSSEGSQRIGGGWVFVFLRGPKCPPRVHLHDSKTFYGVLCSWPMMVLGRKGLMRHQHLRTTRSWAALPRCAGA